MFFFWIGLLPWLHSIWTFNLIKRKNWRFVFIAFAYEQFPSILSILSKCVWLNFGLIFFCKTFAFFFSLYFLQCRTLLFTPSESKYSIESLRKKTIYVEYQHIDNLTQHAKHSKMNNTQVSYSSYLMFSWYLLAIVVFFRICICIWFSIYFVRRIVRLYFHSIKHIYSS